MPVRTQTSAVTTDLMDDLADQITQVRELIDNDTDLTARTPAIPWDIRDSIAHLIGSDLMAIEAMENPDRFRATLPRSTGELDRLLVGHLLARRHHTLGELKAEWGEVSDQLLGLLGTKSSEKVPWFGPAMSRPTMATARLMEYWAHGEDIADGLGITQEPTDRLRHVCHLGYATYEFSFLNRGLPAPSPRPRLELQLPSGKLWTVGTAANGSVRGTALDFAHLVTRRRHRLDTSLEAHGTDVIQWLDIAQCFAGPPGDGRAPQTTRT